MAKCIVLRPFMIHRDGFYEIEKLGTYLSLLSAYFSHEHDTELYVVQLGNGDLLEWDHVQLDIFCELLSSIAVGDGIPNGIPSDRAMDLLKDHGLIDNGIITEAGKQLLAEV